MMRGGWPHFGLAHFGLVIRSSFARGLPHFGLVIFICWLAVLASAPHLRHALIVTQERFCLTLSEHGISLLVLPRIRIDPRAPHNFPTDVSEISLTWPPLITSVSEWDWQLGTYQNMPCATSCVDALKLTDYDEFVCATPRVDALKCLVT